jgi:hypothetical protein
MMNRAFHVAATLGLVLLTGGALLASGPAMAREDDPPAPVVKAAEPPPFCKIEEAQKKAAAETAKPPAGDAAAPADGAAPAKPKLVLRPEAIFTCADGKIKFGIGGRIYGWQIGDVIPINILFSVPAGAAINIDSIMQGKLALEVGFKQPWEMVGKPIVRTVKKDGVTEYDIMIEVRQFMIEPILNFSMQLPYAVEFAADGTPKWQVFTTPVFSLTNSIDGGYDGLDRPMTMGNTALVKPRTPWAVPVLTIVLALLVLAWPTMLIVRRVNRVRTRKSISREAAAWLSMHSAVKSGKEIGFGSTHYAKIGEVLRKFYGTAYPGLEGMTTTEIEALPDEPQANLLKSVFRKLERVLIDERPLSAAEKAQLLREVDQLIKRPYSM